MGRSKNTQPKRVLDYTVTDQHRSYNETPFSQKVAAAVVSTPPPPPRNQNIQKTAKAKKRIRFEEEDDIVLNPKELAIEFNEKEHAEKTNTTTATMAPPEIYIIEATHQEQQKQGMQWTIRIHSSLPSTSPTPNSFAPAYVLRRYHLKQSRVEVAEIRNIEDKSQSCVQVKPIFIETQKGAIYLLKHCEQHYCTGNGEISQEGIEHLAIAVQEKSLRLELTATNEKETEVVLTLANSAFQMCSPTMLPLSSRRRTSKKFQPAIRLHRALAALFSSTIVSEVVYNQGINTHSGNSSSNVNITAKMVYNVMDNVQLNAHYEKLGSLADVNGNRQTPMKINGLMPTLRPYQEAAVSWMLRREGRYQNTSDGENTIQVQNEDSYLREWEMAWVAIVTSPEKSKMEEDIGGSATKDAFHVIPLNDWAKQEKSCKSTVFFYSPYVGWLAQSVKEARRFTIQDILPHWDQDSHSLPNVSGGILADSMGLGKTVEVLACILANPRREGEEEKKEKEDDVSENDTSSFEEEKKQDDREETQNDAASVDASTASGGLNEKECSEQSMIIDCDHDLGECICGRSSKFRNSLSMVVCSNCMEPMHGVCAGFESEGQLRRETVLKTALFDSMQKICRLCKEDRCPCCVAGKCRLLSDGKKNLIESRATLIVTPPSILSQWEREIRRHAAIPTISDGDLSSFSVNLSGSSRPLKVLIDPGVRELSSKSKASRQASSADRPEVHLLHPRVLADADIVLVTFNALMQDLGHSSDNPYVTTSENSSQSRSLRSRKRYRVVPSPLTCIRFWRVCLDEAQRVEAPTAASAKMALQLECVHRWCVSGTPIGKGKLEDLYGLLLFLGLVPYCRKEWFTKCLDPSHSGVMDRVKHLLSSVFWRSTKASPRVRDQMGIPEQVERKVVLRFSSIERHFYDRQLEETLLAASNVVGVEGKKRKASQTDLLALQLHKLRAACCHPQVGSHGICRHNKRKRTHHNASGDNTYGSVNIGSGVLTMEQILDRLIDDARAKCEESQRLSVMHTNALACLAKLKVEARNCNVSIPESDECLLVESCKKYLESLALTESNAKPSTVVGEAMLSGCTGFRSSRKVVRDGKAVLDWQLKTSEGKTRLREVWSRFDFEGPSKKLIEIKIRPLQKVPSDLAEQSKNWQVVRPKDCALQVSNSSVGGEFVDVLSFTLSNGNAFPKRNEWEVFGGFRTNKSKSWRLVVKNYYDAKGPSKHGILPSNQHAFFVGVEIQLMEADIAMDNLQRLHVLHNTTLSLTSLLQHRETKLHHDSPEKEIRFEIGGESVDLSSTTCIRTKIQTMQTECEKLESLYMDAARTVHKESQRQLREATKKREELETDLSTITQRLQVKINACHVTNGDNFWKDGWWDDLLSVCILKGCHSDRLSLCDKIAEELNNFYTDTVAGQASKRRFPHFHNVDGLRMALRIYKDEVLSSSSHSSRIQFVRNLSENPSESEILENSRCGKCRADWYQTGPTCSHCQLDEALEKLGNDPVLVIVLTALAKWSKDLRPSSSFLSARQAARIDERAETFLAILKSAERERLVSRIAWRTHFDLLSDIDELNQCKQTMRLVQEGEDLTKLSEEEQNFIVAPWDIVAKCMEHDAKQAMALGDLRRSKDTLRYLKTQNAERQNELKKDDKTGDPHENDAENCIVCLSAFEEERAVLSCGHSFHYSPCLENLMKSSGNHNVISCPLRCTTRTKREDVLIATSRKKDDGSRATRDDVVGSWGTKVTRLVGDVMDVSELGEKSIVFSQWEDMLEVAEQALAMNKVKYVRVKSLARIGENLKRFRFPECTVLLLNVKNGAEGLTLTEATHLFMIEPLLNCGLDSQAINRIHRIGQTCKTYVHRYLIEDTIEMKIDKMRVERQEDQLEDSIQDAKKKKHAIISAGGIDGGFSAEELEGVLR